MADEHDLLPLRRLAVRVTDRRDFAARYLNEAPYGGLLIEAGEEVEEGDLVELRLKIGTADTTQFIRGLVLWSRADNGRRTVGVGFLATEAGKREALLSAFSSTTPGQTFDVTRKEPRYDTFMRVTCQGDQGQFADYARNISTNGVFIDSREPPAVGEHLVIWLHPPNEPEPIELDGEVAWRQEDHGFGVRFTRADDRVETVVEGIATGRQPAESWI